MMDEIELVEGMPEFGEGDDEGEDEDEEDEEEMDEQPEDEEADELFDEIGVQNEERQDNPNFMEI